MPKQSDDMGRIELYLPRVILDRLRESVPAGDRNSYVAALIARALKVPYAPPPVGRRRKPAPGPA